jgi:outer membrane protein OmpA-like peptidoglycan-associated protein
LQPNGKWGTARNLGSSVNTPFDEDAPFIYSDSKTLYFSSNGHATMGGYDILKTTFNKKDSTWSAPQNLRYPINTPDDDIYFNWNYDGTRAYFSSHRNDSEGGKDIYYLERTEANKPITILKGKLMEKGKDTPPPAIIKMTILKNNNENEVIGIFTSNGKRGNYVFSLPGNAKYNLTAEAPGYVYYNEIIEIPQTDDFQEVVRNIVLEPIKQAVEEKKPIVLNNIYFEYNKAILKEESVVELENVKQLLNTNTNILLEVAGHTDSIGSLKFNQALSEKRAKAVVEYLTANGVPQEKLKSIGYGFLKPVATNATEEGRQKNRRTEFLLSERK